MRRAYLSTIDREHSLALARSLLGKDATQIVSIAVTNGTLTHEWLDDLAGLRDRLNGEIGLLDKAIDVLASAHHLVANHSHAA